MMNTTSDSLRVEIVKKFSNDNILQYHQELAEITNKIAIQWYCQYICSAKMQTSKALGIQGQEIQLEHHLRIVLFDVNSSSHTKN